MLPHTLYPSSFRNWNFKLNQYFRAITFIGKFAAVTNAFPNCFFGMFFKGVGLQCK